MRTTSSLESMNSQLNRFFGKAHPNIFQFIHKLKYHESRKSNKMSMLIRSTTVSKKQMERKRRKDKERDDKIQYFTKKLEKDEIDLRTFLESMANKEILYDILPNL